MAKEIAAENRCKCDISVAARTYYLKVAQAYGFRGMLPRFSRFLCFADERMNADKQHSCALEMIAGKDYFQNGSLCGVALNGPL
jgi:hypothetical protein